MPITQFTKLTPVCSHNLSTMYSIYFDFSSFSYSDFSQNEEATPPIHPQITSIPVEFPSNQSPIHVPVILPLSCISAAAVKIQSAYRRRLVPHPNRPDPVRCGEADRLERLIRARIPSMPSAAIRGSDSGSRRSSCGASPP
ncbi:hypothetical protein IEQ34_008463 [Dendrobium chrysotoxum]|uniref:Uncharacterized protein n=1 Tax=Dendrobium chrysotoxum TaxID=161865 RepID=A0AAV7GZ00_DENCH|nr:hypothetical protein IEQ34_008463 [Dendrobium chrysotoxum]